MDKLPLLVFSAPVVADIGKGRGGGGDKIKYPGHGKQAPRLDLKFQKLHDAMERHAMELQAATPGVEPEMILVLETIGPELDFFKAVQKIKGLEWLAEEVRGDIEPQHGFEYKEKITKQEVLSDEMREDKKKLNGWLYVVMSNQKALEELRRLFYQWKADPNIRLRNNLAPLKHAFKKLEDIRPWGAEDRLRETGIEADWQMRVNEGEQTLLFEAELWFYKNKNRRQKSEQKFRDMISRLGGNVIARCEVEQIRYQGVLGNVPAEHMDQVIKYKKSDLIRFQDMMYLRPVGQCAVRVPDDFESLYPENEEQESLPQGDPVVALFDGLPLAGHQLLNGRLRIDDSDHYEDMYEAKSRIHGTAMASLICRGDMEEAGKPISSPLYVRPIMRPDGKAGGEEAIPEHILPVDLTHRAVRRLFEGDDAVAPSVRIINLSVCDRYRKFDQSISPWARLLDWLAWKYKVLFVVSAGNVAENIRLNVPKGAYKDLSAVQKEAKMLKAIEEDTKHRRLLSPAETVNGITVGSLHQDASSPQAMGDDINPFVNKGLPAIYNTHGLGYRLAVKPDILLPGGRQFVREKIGGDGGKEVLTPVNFALPPGNKVAFPSALNGRVHTFGTSNAAALASRAGAMLLDVINELRQQHGAKISSEYDSVLIKTLLVHSASWGNAQESYKAAFHRNDVRKHISRFLGYGAADVLRVVGCTEQRVTALGVGELSKDTAHAFHFPLPPSIKTVKRRMTVTLAWLTPINPANQKYRIANLSADLKDATGKLGLKRINVDPNTAGRGTVQHEVLEGEKVATFKEGDSVVVKVQCGEDAGVLDTNIQYALAVTLEDAEGVSTTLYQEVQERINVVGAVPVEV